MRPSQTRGKVGLLAGLSVKITATGCKIFRRFSQGCDPEMKLVGRRVLDFGLLSWRVDLLLNTQLQLGVVTDLFLTPNFSWVSWVRAHASEPFQRFTCVR
jgi:hypothetical protein